MYLLKVKVVPGSSRTQVDGWFDEFLKIRVTAKPDKGKANEAVVALLAKTLGITKKNVSIVSGASSYRKMIKINALSEKEINSRLPGRNA